MKLDKAPDLRSTIQQFKDFVLKHWIKPQTQLTAGHPKTLWQQALNNKGWSTPDWPAHLGGTNWTAIERYHWYKVTFQARCPPGDILAKELVGPLLFSFGNSQQITYLDGIRTGTDIWGLARSQGNHAVSPMHISAGTTKLLVILEQPAHQSSLALAHQPAKALGQAGPLQINKEFELLGHSNQAHSMMKAVQLKYPPVAAICRTAGAIDQLALGMATRSTTRQEQQAFAEISIAQHGIEIYCQRLLAAEKTDLMPLVTRAARKIMIKIKALEQNLAGYYGLTAATEPGSNEKETPISDLTDIFQYCEPLDLFDSFAE